jgi:hypothetical protein
MAVQSPGQTREYSPQAAYDDGSDHGYGWVIFAGVMLLVLGTLNFIEGIAAISNSHFFVANTNYILGSLNTWGWIVLIIGVIQWTVGLGVFAKTSSHGGSVWRLSALTRSRSC